MRTDSQNPTSPRSRVEPQMCRRRVRSPSNALHEECGRRRSPGPNGRNGVMDTIRSSRRCSHPRPPHMTISRQSSREAAQRHTREASCGRNFTPPLTRHREHRREEHRAHRQERPRPSPEAVSSTRCSPRCSPRCSHRPSHPPYRAQSLTVAAWRSTDESSLRRRWPR